MEQRLDRIEYLLLENVKQNVAPKQLDSVSKVT
jgi:hypothetical protein